MITVLRYLSQHVTQSIPLYATCVASSSGQVSCILEFSNSQIKGLLHEKKKKTSLIQVLSSLLLTSKYLTHNSPVPMFLKSSGLFHPTSLNRDLSLTALCTIQILCSTAGHSARLLTRNNSLSTQVMERSKLSLVFYQIYTGND